jgi:hypothetical protein
MSQSLPDVVCARITGSDAAIRRFVTKHKVNVEASARKRDSVSITVFIPAALAEKWEHGDLKVEVLYNATERGRERQKEVGKGNQFAEDKGIPKGLGELVRGKTK